jgi:hypothetical protein
MANPEPPVPGPLGSERLSGSGRTEEQHWKYVLRKLGGGVVDIELTSRGDVDPLTGREFPSGETHMDDCLADTKRWFALRVGMRRVVQVMLVNGQSDYLMPAETTEVIDVVMPSFQLPSLDADQFSFTYFSLLFGQWTNPNVAPMPYSDLVQRLQYLEQIGRIFSTDRDIEYRPETRTLHIWPPPASLGAGLGGGGSAGAMALALIWSRDVDTRLLDPQDEDFFRRKLLIEAMRTLGNIRTKTDSWVAMGGERALNGDTLMANADAMADQLKQDVLNWKRPVPLISG